MLDFVKGLLDPQVRERKSFEKLVAKLLAKNYQHEDRMLAIETLAEMDTPQAITALFRRWDITAEKEREDRAEKEYLADVLVAKGERMLPALRSHNDRSVNVTLPVQVLRRVVGTEEVVTEILRVLALENGRLASFKPEKKGHLLRLLADQSDPRSCPAVVPMLDDFDETVRYEAAEFLGMNGDLSHAGVLVDRLISPREDSARVRGAILDVLCRNGWAVGDRKAEIAPYLNGYTFAADGTLSAP